MTLIMKPGIRLRKTWQPMDPDAAAYITAVEAADLAAGQSGGLEEKTKIAIDNFVLGCKADGTWNAIKASCILAGARTRQGALVPLVGTAPTPFNFVDADYNRKTGLGDASNTTKYINTNRAENADPLDSVHTAAFITGAFGSGQFVLHGADGGNATGFYRDASAVRPYSRSSTALSASNLSSLGFIGASRSASNLTSFRMLGFIGTSTVASNSRNTTNYNVFRSPTYASGFYGTGRLAFYSIGESINLALLDARVTDLINAIGVAF